MNDNVEQVDQDPVGGCPAFHTVRAQPGGFGFFFDIAGDSGYMAV